MYYCTHITHQGGHNDESTKKPVPPDSSVNSAKLYRMDAHPCTSRGSHLGKESVNCDGEYTGPGFSRKDRHSPTGSSQDNNGGMILMKLHRYLILSM